MQSREACRRVPVVPQGAHARVAALAERIRLLLQPRDALPSLPPPAPPATPQPSQAPPQPQPTQHHQLEQIFGQFGFNVETIRTDVDNMADELGLPPLSGHHIFTSAEWVPDVPMPEPAPDLDAPLPMPEMSTCDVRPP